ncbi:DNA-binding LacI/PurR family transcriptional regulator [Streptomyces sp. SAI-135]|uniref:LacI family DNA-binding transcriptional regulator n=1 Tax=unclassified Streptomyces TaxID=2593676 RepID=UPI002474A2B0|nr:MULTISPECIES: LacI family DNA-binding transcriptional regulator [unclassified Streptomyces]MDH6523049.1 DNA-binding LacI/PurR family transcriptional regulator [Streptomyces sp. SAI-090]MDH6573932.1 DNA-binding LacI/PurR family transcriptional regulator [Streptomyces sp. SAI-117]MDH6581331.1 DNA-binding LacI/PurR family transcriptional regulator [Streptomyces sp. SAI-133]MDH6613338.1 DNA-binding LacI/PurR family transcriptional regulator [Streptomyces sp. SAI-135]
MTRPRIKDVARLAGVSEKTVSNVINDYAHVSERTRRAVRDAIEQLGYKVNLAGRHLRQGRTGIIALVVPELDVPYFAELARHVIREAEQRSLTVLIHDTGADRDHELAALTGFGSSFVDGVILSPLALTPDDLRDRAGAPPTVLIGELLEEGADHVAIDNEKAAREATEHLLSLGRRSILVIGGRDEAGLGTAEARTRGYLAALREAGVAYDPGALLPVRSFGMPDGAEAVNRVLGQGGRPDALLCLNDQLALGALRALYEHGIRVPEEVAVIGFDDVEAGRFSVPTLSTVAPDKAAIARVAVELLQRRMDEVAGPTSPDASAPGPRSPQDLVVAHRLVLRESTEGAGAARSAACRPTTA